MWFHRFPCVKLAWHPSSSSEVNSSRSSFDSPRELEFFRKDSRLSRANKLYWLFSLRFFSFTEEKPVDKRYCAVFYVSIWLNIWVISFRHLAIIYHHLLMNMHLYPFLPRIMQSVIVQGLWKSVLRWSLFAQLFKSAQRPIKQDRRLEVW